MGVCLDLRYSISWKDRLHAKCAAMGDTRRVYAVPSLALLAQLPARVALRGSTWKPPQDSALK
eukprot:875545-Pelagomonas_calceolata.AAC.1